MFSTKFPITLFTLLVFAGFVVPAAYAAPIPQIPNLESITFWEKTGGTEPNPFTFGVNSSELTTRLSDPLGFGNYDFTGVQSPPYIEAYDVFYSDADGSFNVDGSFVTIEAVWNRQSPAGGGLNIAEVELNFTDGSTQGANSVESFVALGDNAYPGTVEYAVDGNLLTHTTMGNTIGQSQRLRVTVGFSMPTIPATIDFDPDTLNLKSKGKFITCYIELPEGYDVNDIDVDTILLEDVIEVQNSDVQDSVLMVKFDKQDVIYYIENILGITSDDVTLTVTGEVAEILFEGSDTIRVINNGK